MHDWWTSPERVRRVVLDTGCTEAEAVDYLLAEEGVVADAITSYQVDRRLAAQRDARDISKEK